MLTLNSVLLSFYIFAHSQFISRRPLNQFTFLHSDLISHRPVFFAAARYCSMLLEEGGLQQLELVHTHPQTHSDVKLLAKSILESLQNHRARTGQPAPTQTSRRAPSQ